MEKLMRKKYITLMLTGSSSSPVTNENYRENVILRFFFF